LKLPAFDVLRSNNGGKGEDRDDGGDAHFEELKAKLVFL
jgi:hypothetical protein